MKLKRIKIIVQPEEDFFEQVGEAFSAVSKASRKGEKISRPTPVLSFPSIKEMARMLTPKRLELLTLIRRNHPQSVRQLA